MDPKQNYLSESYFFHIQVILIPKLSGFQLELAYLFFADI